MTGDCVIKFAGRAKFGMKGGGIGEATVELFVKIGVAVAGVDACWMDTGFAGVDTTGAGEFVDGCVGVEIEIELVVDVGNVSGVEVVVEIGAEIGAESISTSISMSPECVASLLGEIKSVELASATLVVDAAIVVVAVFVGLGNGVLAVVAVAATIESVCIIALFVLGEAVAVVLAGVVTLDDASLDIADCAKVGIELLNVVCSDVLFEVDVAAGIEANTVGFVLLDG